MRTYSLDRDPLRTLFPADPSQQLSTLGQLINTTRSELWQMLRTGDYSQFEAYRNRVRKLDDAFPNDLDLDRFWQGLGRINAGP